MTSQDRPLTPPHPDRTSLVTAVPSSPRPAAGDDDRTASLAALARRVVMLVARDAESARLLARIAAEAGVLGEIRSFAAAFLSETETTPPPEVEGAGGDLRPPEVPSQATPGPPPLTKEGGPGGPGPERATATAAAPLPELTLGRPRPAEPPPPAAARTSVEPETGAGAETELAAVEARCRLKAEGVRWAATRRDLQADGANFRVEIAPKDRDLLDRARALPDCFLWMNAPGFDVPDDPAWSAEVADCFEAVADLAALVRAMDEAGRDGDEFARTLDLLAEAQSALRVAIDRAGGPRDPDQFRVYQWLCDVAARRRIYIRRHMRLEDPADPARLRVLRAKVASIQSGLRSSREQARRLKSGIGKVRYHAGLIREGDGGEHDWRKVAEALGELVDGGTPPSSLEVREALLPILDDLPDLGDVPAGFALVLREVDRYLALRPEPDRIAPDPGPTPEVEAVARLLAGREALLIGGVRRPAAHAALKEAFGLDDLIWFETREHESIDVFEPSIRRPEVALVLLAIRWSSHSFGDVKRFCDRSGKPLVRLPGGYNPNQVAAQILAQSSVQLAAPDDAQIAQSDRT